MGLFDRVQQHREEKNEPKPEKVWRNESKSKGQKLFAKKAEQARVRVSGANKHFEYMRKQMAKKLNKKND